MTIVGEFLVVTTVEVLFYAFPAVGQDLKQFFSGAVEPLKQVSAHFRKSFAQPPKLILPRIFDLIFLVELFAHRLHLLAQSVVLVNQHPTEHVVGGSVQRIEVLLVFAVELAQLLLLGLEQLGKPNQDLINGLYLVVSIVLSPALVRKI